MNDDVEEARERLRDAALNFANAWHNAETYQEEWEMSVALEEAAIAYARAMPETTMPWNFSDKRSAGA